MKAKPAQGADAPTVTQHRFWEEMTPLGCFSPWNLGSGVAWGVFACVRGHEGAPGRTGDNPRWRGHGLGSFQGWRTCPAGLERPWECVYCPRPAAGLGLPFLVPTDAIPSQSRGQLRRRNGNSSRPRECTAGKSIISVIYRLQL